MTRASEAVLERALLREIQQRMLRDAFMRSFTVEQHLERVLAIAAMELTLEDGRESGEEQAMETVAILGYALGLLPTVTLGVQTLVGDKAAGKDKKQMALDALEVALQGASSVLTPGGTNAQLAGAAGTAAAEVIDVAGTIAAVIAHLKKTSAVTTAVNLTKATGAYQAATVQANALHAAAASAAAPAVVPVVAA